MGTQLSSLRVSADMDSSNYVQGAQKLALANQQAADSATKLAAAIDQTNNRLEGWNNAAQFQKQVTAAAQAQDAATSSSSHWVKSLDEIGVIASVAGHALSFFATTGIGQATALGGAFTLMGVNFQNSTAKNIVTGTSDILLALGTAARTFAVVGLAAEAMNAITELGVAQMASLVAIAGKAQTAGVAPSFFQQQTKAADDLGSSVDNATKAMDSFYKALQPSGISGSTLDQTLQTLVKAGNFAGNSGVAEFNTAVTTQQKWGAIVDLITQAETQGQRLAAIDLASKFLPPSMLLQLEATGDFLKQWQEASKDITPPFSDVDVARAVTMNNLLTSAQDTLGDKWKPIMADLTNLGLQWEYGWIGVVQLMAQASTLIGTIYNDVKAIASTQIGSGLLLDLTRVVPFLGTIVNSMAAVTNVGNAIAPTNPANSLTGAKAQLATGLGTPGAVQAAELAATNMEMSLLGDTSKKTADSTDAVRDAYDRLVTSLEKHALTNQADILTIGQSQAATASLNAEFQLLEASLTANRGVTQAQISDYVTLRGTMSAHQALVASGISLSAKDAAAFDRTTTAIQQTTAALEKAKADEAIKFSGGLLGLSDNDVAIVNQLKPLFGDNITAALNSSEASALRLQKTISDWKGYATDFTGTLLNGLQQGLDSGRAIGSALESAANQFSSAMGKTGTQNIVGGLMTGSLSSIGSGLTDFGIGAAISLVTGSLAKSQQAQQQFQQAQATWAGMASQVAAFVCAMMSEPETDATAPSGAVEKRIGKDGANVINFAARRKSNERDQLRRAA